MTRVAIVTGGTRGIGRAICERLRDERQVPQPQMSRSFPHPVSLAARGESPAAFDRRCIPPGVAQAFRSAMARLKPRPTTLSSVKYCR